MRALLSILLASSSLAVLAAACSKPAEGTAPAAGAATAASASAAPK